MTDIQLYTKFIHKVLNILCYPCRSACPFATIVQKDYRDVRKNNHIYLLESLKDSFSPKGGADQRESKRNNRHDVSIAYTVEVQ